MTEHTHVVVWMDHREARVFHFNAQDAEKVTLHPHAPSRHVHHRGNAHGSSADQQHYLHEVVEAIGHAQAVLITGPANAKTELVKHIEKHDQRLKKAIAAVETVDHPSDGQLLAHARQFFKAYDLTTPQKG